MFRRRKYKNPPAIEVLCEVFFSETQNDLTLFGDFYQKVKTKYPQQKQINSVGVEMNFSQDLVQAKHFNQNSMMRFSKEDNSQLVQITQNLITFNKLKPYEGYENFKQSFEDVLQEYIILAKPKYLEKISMRYIDKISIPEDKFSLEKYFNFSLNFANHEFSSINGISFNVQITPKHPSHQLIASLNSVTSTEEGKSEFLLDMYDNYTMQNSVDVNYILQILDEAHENLEYVFEAVITDSSRNLFEEVE